MASIVISGDTSGAITIAAPAIAGTNTLNLPAATGNILTDAADVTVAQGGTGVSSLTAYAVMCGGTTSTGAVQSIASVGTSGQVLTSNGAGALPTFQTPVVAGTLLRAPQVLTSGTSYTTPANCTAIYIEALGGGGGGGGTDSTVNSIGGAGAAGAYCAKYFDVTPSTAYTYAIGSAGNGGSSGTNAGTAGGNTTFTVGATTIIATGGTAGAAGGTQTSKVSASVTSTSGDINGSSESGVSLASTVTNTSFFSKGGSTLFGGGGLIAAGIATNTSGAAGTGYGTGGSGGWSANASRAGGSGKAGIIRIWEFA